MYVQECATPRGYRGPVSVVGVCLVRNAADIIGPVIRHMLTQVDAVLVADNLSDDSTRDTLETLEAVNSTRLVIVDDPDPAHRQSVKTTGLAQLARSDLDATWIVPFDSDELWYSPFGRIADELDALPSSIFVATATLYDHVATGADNRNEPDPTSRLGWRRREPGPFPKVACRAAPDLTIAEGNHSAHYGDPRFPPPTALAGRLIVRHYPYRSAEQMAAKAKMGAAALRAAPELGEHTGKHWRDYDALGPELLAEVFAEHFYAETPRLRRDLVFDPAPR